jgi:esterase/lipase superfamily enzyme
MTWGRTLENALKSKGISKDFDEWIAIAKDRSKWRHLTQPIPKPPDLLMPDA